MRLPQPILTLPFALLSNRRSLLVTLLLLMFLGQSDGATVRVSVSYGYSAVDATTFVQAALDDPTADTVILDAAPGVWRTRALQLRRTGLVLVFEPATRLEDVPGALGQFESLMRIIGVSGVRILGNGATIAIDKSLYPANSEFRHCIQTSGAVDVVISNLTLTGAAGDGVEVSAQYVSDGAGGFAPTVPSRNVRLSGLTCTANNRQGCSVISVIGLLIENCTFSNTQGTLPEAGVDIEPFQPYQFVQNVVIRNSTFSGNHGSGILVALIDLNSASPPVDILVEDCLLSNNGLGPGAAEAAFELLNYNRIDGSTVPGTLVVTGTTIRDESGIGINVRQWASGVAVSFHEVLLDNVLNLPFNAGAAPITIQPRSFDPADINDPCFGNVAFSNVRINDDLARLHVNLAQYGSAGATAITGNVCVQAPGGPQYRTGPAPCTNVTLTVSACSPPLPLALVAFTATSVDCAHTLAWRYENASLLTGFRVEASYGEAWVAVARLGATASQGAGVGEWQNPEGDRERYYRLVSEFTDGTESVSEVLVAAGCRNEATRLLTVDAQGGLLRVAIADRDRTFELIDGLGRMTVGGLLLPAGSETLHVGALLPGLWVLRELGGPGVGLTLR